MFFSVLEQFEITKFPKSVGLLLFTTHSCKERKVIFFFEKIALYISQRFFSLKYKRYTLKKLFYRLYKFVVSFFYPSRLECKTYTYAKLMRIGISTYLKILTRRKLWLFIRYNAIIIKFKIQLNFQYALETNFGRLFPYYNRLLNFSPYLYSLFLMILCHNFNGLYFYGFTNTAFLLQNFVMSFQTVVGLTIIVFSLDLIFFIKCLFLLMFLFYYYLFLL